MSEYSIIIEVKGGGRRSGAGSTQGSTDSANNAGNDGTSSSQQLAQGSGEFTLKQLRKAVAVTGAAAMATKIVNYKTTRVYTETGNRQWQDNINAAKQVGGQIASVVGGFVAGGVIGGVAAIGAVAVDYALKYDSYNFAKQMEATTLSVKRERVGVGGMAISRSRASNQ